MGKRILLKVVLLFFFLSVLNILRVQAQCTDGPTNPATVSITLQGSNNICSDENISFTSSIDLDDGINPQYQWETRIGAGAWTELSGETSTTLNNFSPVQNNSQYRLRIRFCDGTGQVENFYSNNSATITVNQVTTATATIYSNKTDICPNETINFSASLTNQGGSPTFSWRVNGVERGTASSFSWDQFDDNDNVELWMTSSRPCTDDGDADSNNTVESNIININVKPGIPAQPDTISGADTVCPTTPQTYSVTGVTNATEYEWFLPAGWTGTSSTNSITVTPGPNGGTLSVAAKNECGSSSNQVLNVTVLPDTPNTPGSISGATAVCPAESQTYSVTAVPEATSYEWTLPNGWTGTSTTNSITVTTGNTGNGNIGVKAINSCGSSSESQLPVTVKSGIPDQPSAITGDIAVCPGVSKTYTVNAVSGVTYNWTLPSGWTGNSTGNSITVNTGATGGTISVTASNDCGTGQARTLTVTSKPGTPATPGNFTSGPTSLCPGTNGTYTVPSTAGATEYIWTLPPGFSTPNLTTTSPSIVVTAGSSGSGNINVVARNDCGTSPARSLAVSIANPAPVMTGSISGPTKVCKSTTGIQYSIPSITNATTYTWTVPAGWNITNGQGTNTISLSTPGTVSTNNNISVVASNSCGASTSVSISVNASNSVPGQPGPISTSLPSNAVCPPVNGVTFSVPNVSGTTYNWIVPNGFQIVNGQGTNQITVNITAGTPYANNLKVEVEAVNACGPSTRRTYNNIDINDYAFANLGSDQTVCSTTNPLNLSGSVGFGTGGIKIESLTTNGTGTLSNIPNGKVTNFNYTYTPSAQDVTNGSVTLTLTTEAPSGKPNCSGQGTDQMTIFFRPFPSASLSAGSPICAGNTSILTFTGTPNTRVTYRIGTGADQFINLGSSGTETLTTAPLTSNTTYNLRNIQYQTAPNCSNPLTGSVTVNVTQPPTATISYTGPFCTTLTNSQTVNLSGTGAYTGGTFSQPPGLNIDSAGSIIPSSSSPGTYTVEYTTPASGGCEAVTTSTTVTIQEETIISNQPIDTRACEGDDVSFGVTATGENLSYQWYFNSVASGNEISGATDSTLNLNGISEFQEGNYIVVVNNSASCAAVTSAPALLTVDQEIIVETQPTDTVVCEGDNTSLNVSASSGGASLDGTFAYQWYKGTPGSGTILPNMNAPSLPINSAVPGDSGNYYVIISGSSEFTCQAVISEVAILDVRPTPTVSISGDNNICDGEASEIYFTGGTPNALVTYTLNGDNVNPQTILLDNNGEAILSTGPLTATNNADTPFVYEITSVAYPNNPDCQNNVNGTATITVAPNPTVTISFAGDQTEFCTQDSNSYTPVLTGAGTYSGGTFSASGLTINPPDGSFVPSNNPPGNYTINYSVPEYGGCPEEITSLDISIYEEVVITSEPFNLGICSTNDAEFSVSATGDNLTYQWYKVVGNPDISTGINETNDVELSGETSAILSLPVATSADAGYYYVRISGTNACTPTEDTQVNSEVVSLNVDEDIVIIEPAETMAVCASGDESVTFEFVAHANGTPLSFEWIYSNGSSVLVNENDPEGRYVSEVNPVSNYDNTGVDVYVGTLTINNIILADQNSYAVKITGPSTFTCPEAISNSFNLDVNPIPDAPGVQNVVYCVGDIAVPLEASGEPGATFTWYDANMNVLNGAPTPNTNVASVETYHVTQTDYIPNADIYCISEVATITVTINELPPAPPLTNDELTIIYCLGDTASALTATSSGADYNINWYGPGDPELSLSQPPVPPTTSQGSINYWVSQTDGNSCESEKVQVTVGIYNLPDISITNSGNDTICEGEEITLTATDVNDINSTTTYEWTWDTGSGSINGQAQNFSPSETTTYTVTATNEYNCVNIEQFTINVDTPPVGGILTGPDTVCEANPSGSLDLTEYAGTITQWEYRLEGEVDWTIINEPNPDANYTFTNLTGTTHFRVLVSNGVCTGSYSNEVTVNIDLVPQGGQLTWAKNGDRLFLTCQNPAPGYGSALNLNGQVGPIIQWEYRGVSANTWQTLDTDAASLTASQVESMVLNETTAIRVRIQGNSCGPDVFSETALVSVIEADIKPSPVEVDKEVICIGDTITLSSETGYGAEGGKFDGGAFDNAALDNSNTWRFQDADGTVYNFESSANNGRANHWLRMNPHGNNPNPNEKVYTANLYPIDQQGPGNGYMVNFRTFSTNAGNKGFALVTGNNDSNFETPIFSLGGLDEAILTWDQAYNLTEGAKITVEISTNGGSTYQNVLFDTIGTATSGNYDNFGDGTPATRPLNKMVVDLGAYIGMSNLRLRWRYEGTIDGDVWAVDNIKVPEGPQDILLQWYYDDDLNDPDNYLEPIGVVNQYTVNFVPRKIGWNDFEVQTRIILDSNGDECQSIENFETIRVWAFDRYTTNVEAITGSCGSFQVTLNAEVYADYQAAYITEYPTLDGYVGSWRVEDLNGNEVTSGFTLTNQDSQSGLDPVQDPNAIFTADAIGDFNFRWILTPTILDDTGALMDNSGCPPIDTPGNVTLVDCSTLDFDGYDDYVDLGNSYTGNFFIEAWIRPFSRSLPGGGTTSVSQGSIISGPGFDINMQQLAGKFTPNGRWYHIAVANNGKLWVDGIESGSITISSAQSNRTIIGARWNASTQTTENLFSGWIEEVRIWNKDLTLKQIRFMMNQRLKVDASGTVVSPLQGEVVPNLMIPDGGLSSYYNDGTYNLDQDGDPFYDLSTSDLAGYYRLISEIPDPLGLVSFPANQQPSGGETPDLSTTKIPGRLYNITTHQENTSPTPYFSAIDGQNWDTVNTWARPAVWDHPNSDGINGAPIEWNIARISHNINTNRNVTMLGLLSLDKELTVESDNSFRVSHYLLLDGGIDLEGESQLLQDHGSILDNSSLGWLERDQQGRKSSYNYNYWTSPVSVQGTPNNSGFHLGGDTGVLLDGTNPGNPLKITFANGYFVADGPKTSPLTLSNYWIWMFRGGIADVYAQWEHLGSDHDQYTGAGFTMKGTTGDAGLNDLQNYVFKGKPHNGNIFNLSIGNNQNYLVGNPYPSAIDGYEFIKDNLIDIGNSTGNGQNENNENVFNGSLYFWDHFSGKTHILEDYIGGYAVLNLSSGIPAISSDWRIDNSDPTLTSSKTPKRYIPVAQGFFINSQDDTLVDGRINRQFSGNIIFKNTQRIFVKEVGGDPNYPSTFLIQNDNNLKSYNTPKASTNREPDSRPKIRLKFQSPIGYHRQILVTKDANTTNNFDLGYDAPLIENNIEDMYWWFDNNRFVIQGVPHFEKDQVLPLAIKTKAEGRFVIKIDSTENWPTEKKVYLKDKELDSIHDILNEPYIGMSAEGENKERFEIVFHNPDDEVATTDPDPIDPDPTIEPEPTNPDDLPIIDGLVGISYSHFTRQVKISNFDLLEVNKVMIFDMNGKLIQEFEGLPTQAEILLSLRPVRSGVYIVKAFCENGVCNKKIVIK